MVDKAVTIQQAIDQFDRNAISNRRAKAEQERQEVISRFPIAKWPTLSLEQYALGQENSEDTFSRWLEFRSQTIASMKGGNARKHLIYKHANQPGWYFDSAYGSVEQAWEAVRNGFVEVFARASRGEWDTIDDIAALQGGPALRIKTLYIYFPTEILCVCSHAHIKHFLLRLAPDALDPALGAVSLNRRLLAAVRSIPPLADWTNWEIMCLLYSWADPRKARRIVKIAPGENAKYWQDCLDGSYICVGWDDVGDLSKFESKDAFKQRFEEVFGAQHNRTKLAQKSNELWTLRELEPGDIVVANKGTSHVLAIGEVGDPGYEYRTDRPEYKHTVSVDWDRSYDTDVPVQKKWAFVTVARVPTDLYETIVSKRSGSGPPIPFDPFYEEIAEALERKGQVILYGPPGTGKTYTGRRVCVWWLLKRAGNRNAQAILADPKQFAEAEKSLTTIQVTQRVWWMVANPANWSWHQLKSEKKVQFDYARLQGNFARVQVGDLVIGYQSAPDKRVVALAKISRGLEKSAESVATIELSYLCDLTNGLTYDELLADEILKNSEPMRFRNRGTLFALAATEAERTLTILSERDPEVSEYLDDGGRVGQLTRLTFHPSYSYEDFIEGFRPVESGSGGLTLRLEDGVFKRVCREAQANPDKDYLVLIDEINRANVAKVLGELITLIEYDKRGLIVTLPQSKESFAIPKNVYLLGTMNTADRSIKLLDAAIRRRFAFVELMPDVELLHGAKVGALDLAEFLVELNGRIAQHVGREKQIGHSFFMEGDQPVTDVDEFARRFRQEVLPLLQEYCYDDFGALARYLGDGLVDQDTQMLRADRLEDPDCLLAALEEEFSSPVESQT